MNEKIERKILDYRESIKAGELFKALPEDNLMNIKDLQDKCSNLLDKLYEIEDCFVFESLSDIFLLPFDENYGSSMQRLRFDLKNECIDSLFLTRVEPWAINDVTHFDNSRIEDAAKFNEIYHEGYYLLDLADNTRLEEGTFDEIKDFLFNLKYEDIVELLMQNLASAAQCYLDLGGESNIREALSRFEEVLAWEKRVKGSESPDTLTTMHVMAQCYLLLGGESNIHEALSRFEEVLAWEKRVKGSESPDTLTTMHVMAQCYLLLGGESNIHEALSRFEEVLVLEKRVKGAKSSDTLTTMGMIAGCYLNLGGESNIQEALRRFEEVLALEKCVKGAESPGTLTAMHMIARCYLKLSGESNTQEALNRFEEVLPLVKRIKGEESPDTLTTMRCIALCYLNLEGESNTQEMFNRLDEVRVLLSRIRRRDRSILLDSKK